MPDDLKELYKTSWEMKQRNMIDMAADRGAFIDQSQSLNIFMENPNFGKLTSMCAPPPTARPLPPPLPQ